MDFTIVRPLPMDGIGVFACASAARISFSTAGSASVAALGSRTNRFCVPIPSRIPSGSGSVAP